MKFTATAPATLLAAFVLAFHAGTASAAPVRVAGADIGSKGVRAVVVEYDPAAPMAPPSVLYRGVTNPNTGLVKDGKLVPGTIAETVDNLAEFVRVFTTVYGVPQDRIELVGSSALAALPDRATLATLVEEKTKVKMKFLTSVSEEARLAIAGLAVLGNRPRGLMLDFGSGNTKGGVITGTGLESFEVPYGTGSLITAVRKAEAEKKVPFREAFAGVRATELLPAARKALADKPALAGQTQVTIIGGITYAVATLTHPEQPDATTVTVTLADFRKLTDMLAKDPLQFPTIDLGSLPAEVKKQAELNVTEVKALFNPEQLLAGCAVVLAVGDELKLDGKPLTFVRGAQYAWIVGYLTPAPPPSAPPPPSPPPSAPPPSAPPPSSAPQPPAIPTIQSVRPPEPLPMGVPYVYAPWTETGYYLLPAGQPWPRSPYVYPGYGYPNYYTPYVGHPWPTPSYGYPGYVYPSYYSPHGGLAGRHR